MEDLNRVRKIYKQATGGIVDISNDEFLRSAGMGGQFVERGWEDREVKVRRSELLEVLRKNRNQHISDYNTAVAGYKEEAIAKINEVSEDLKSKVRDLKEGKTIASVHVGFNLPAPVSHERAYDQIIKMMEMSVDDEIQLTSGQFSCFVMDDWDWKRDWTMSNSSYMTTGGARR